MTGLDEPRRAGSWRSTDKETLKSLPVSAVIGRHWYKNQNLGGAFAKNEVSVRVDFTALSTRRR
jgi:hypothetical protein